jgi:lipopolysaccharide/colanic/teichoic acid biosynthesis glycosyltransferase
MDATSQITGVPERTMCGGPALSPAWQSTWQRAGKRLLDIVVSAILLIVLMPLLILMAVAIWVTSPGPVFYRWKVVGQGGRRFQSYKFRSMVANADALKAALEARNEMRGPIFKITDDPRITPIGRWMRRYSIDELPQLYSVLIGDMSLVGPRPPLQTEFEQFTEQQKQKVAVTQGITCLWQVSGRNEIADLDHWVALDLEYIRAWSLWLDLKILARTANAVISASGK